MYLPLLIYHTYLPPIAKIIFTGFYYDMKISPVNYQPQETSFKATYPVVHRIVYKGTYIPVSEFDKLKKMQGKLIRTLNSSFTKLLNSLDKDARQNVMRWTQSADLSQVKGLELPKTEKEALAIFRGRFGYYDTDYAFAPKPQQTKKPTKNSEERVRTFYNRAKGMLDGRYYLTYMVSGKDIKPFEDELAKNIGKNKHEAKGINLEDAPELQEAITSAVDKYTKQGLEFVNNSERRLASKTTGMTYILRANFEPIFNKKGIVKDYKFISAKFVPEYTK